jgi:3-deoxy-7-phosphoheptulonate synthase
VTTWKAATGEYDAEPWDQVQAGQQPAWHRHPARARCRQSLLAAPPIVSPAELTALRRSLAAVAAGEARVIQAGDCAESFYECTDQHVQAKIGTLDLLADQLAQHTGQPVVRVGRIGGQFAKPRSQPTERHAGVEIPVFRGHMVNSEVPRRAARVAEPRRMLWAYEASVRVLDTLRAHREARACRREPGSGPWSSHEALVLDYESALVRTNAGGTTFLGSTHLPWVGERTRQPGSAHLRLLSTSSNPVGCKIGPSCTFDELVRLCATLDPERTPGRLVLIPRLGHNRVTDVLTSLVAAVRRAGHPAIWLCDPMHGNTTRTASGVKTRRLGDIVAETRAFTEVLLRQGQHLGGLHLEVAADNVTECVDNGGVTVDTLARRYTTLCDPRLNPPQALELIDVFNRL